jgi:processive 1,2-diacylglycerol beta-glucosyltransferase
MKKILIFTAGFGEGHNTAARNVRDAVEHIAPDEAKVEVLDLFDSCYGKLNDWVRKAYIAAINRTPRVWGKIYNVIDGTQFVESNMAILAKMKRAMSDLLAELEPDAVVSTYPIYNCVIDAIYSDGRPKTFAQVTVITDTRSS